MNYKKEEKPFEYQKNGLPDNFEIADKWASNSNQNNKNNGIKWQFDCFFKLDYDGDLMAISSRFYPPSDRRGLNWGGYVSVYILEDEIHKKQFACETLEDLRQQVEEYVFKLVNTIKSNQISIVNAIKDV